MKRALCQAAAFALSIGGIAGGIASFFLIVAFGLAGYAALVGSGAVVLAGAWIGERTENGK